MQEIYKDCNPENFEISEKELSQYGIWFNSDSTILTLAHDKRIVCEIEFYSKLILRNDSSRI